MATKPDLSEFFKLSRPKRPPCRVGFVASQLPEEEADQLQAACATDAGIINAGAIQQWIVSRGHDVSVPGITAHRQGRCTCGE